MRILLVSGRYDYGNPARGDGYEYTNFLPALRSLGHDVEHFDSWDRSSYSGFADLNRALLSNIERFQPHLVLAVQAHYEIWMETWAVARDAMGVLVVNWATDDSWRYRSFSRLVAPSFDVCATTDADAYAKYRRDGHAHPYLTQWGMAAASLRPPLAAKDCSHQVSFVGSARPARRAWVERLKSAGIEVECLGHGWQRGSVPASEIPEIMRKSVISLNFADSVKRLTPTGVRHTTQIKARNFEVSGSGGFLLAQWVKGLDRFYGIGQEIAVFRDFGELTRQIERYLTNHRQRDRCALAGYARTARDHTYEARFAALIDFAQGVTRAGHRRGSPEAARAAFDRAVTEHTNTGGMRVIANWSRRAASLAWGPQRGPRAARQLFVEMSWRLAGRRTYAAKGLPGRLFFRES